jgi:hypothetical protein
MPESPEGQLASDRLPEILRAFEPYTNLAQPPKEAIRLGQIDNCTVYLDSALGPAVPYPPVDHRDGYHNHGYRRLKGNPGSIGSLPEVIDWPEYRDFLEVVNGDLSPIESVGCDKALFPFNQGNAKARLGSYTDLVFTELSLNADPRNHLLLAAELATALNGSAQWWSDAEFGLQLMRGLFHVPRAWCLLVRVTAYGRDVAEARKLWTFSLGKLGERIRRLPIGFFIPEGP